MSQAMLLSDVVDAADQLSVDEKEAHIAILHRCLAEESRRRLIAEVQEAKKEYAAGQCRAVAVEKLMREIEL